MQLDTITLDGGITRVNLTGRMDIPGTAAIEIKFSALASGPQPRLLVDLSQVSFLASIGLRALFANARTIKQRGRRMALVNPEPMVAKVLETSAVETLIPVFQDLDAACEALRHS